MRKGNKITEFLPTQEARRTSKGNPIKTKHAEEENQSQILQKDIAHNVNGEKDTWTSCWY